VKSKFQLMTSIEAKNCVCGLEYTSKGMKAFK